MHRWFLRNLAKEEGGGKLHTDVNGVDDSSQSIDEILSIIQEARKPGEGPKVDGQFDQDEMDADDDMDDLDSDDFDFVCDV